MGIGISQDQVHGSGVAIGFEQCNGFLMLAGCPQRKAYLLFSMRLNLEYISQAEDGIEYVANGSGQGRITYQSGGSSEVPTPADESGPVGLVLYRIGRVAGHCPMEHQYRCLILTSAPSLSQQGVVPRQMFGLDKELGKGRMGSIRRHLVEHHLGVAGQLDPSPLIRPVMEGATA
jgi:hypothetical protein